MASKVVSRATKPKTLNINLAGHKHRKPRFGEYKNDRNMPSVCGSLFRACGKECGGIEKPYFF